MAGKRDGETEGIGDGLKSRKTVVRRHTDLEVYQVAFDTAMRIFEASKSFPREEIYSLTDQMRRSSRSVCANLAEAWRKRRYAAAFVSKLNDSEGEAAEVQTRLELGRRFGYVTPADAARLDQEYEEILDPRDLKFTRNVNTCWFDPADDIYRRRESLGFARYGFAELIGFSAILGTIFAASSALARAGALAS